MGTKSSKGAAFWATSCRRFPWTGPSAKDQKTWWDQQVYRLRRRCARDQLCVRDQFQDQPQDQLEMYRGNFVKDQLAQPPRCLLVLHGHQFAQDTAAAQRTTHAHARINRVERDTGINRGEVNELRETPGWGESQGSNRLGRRKHGGPEGDRESV